MIDLRSIPLLSEHIYKKKINTYTLLYNSHSQKRMILLRKQASVVLNHINGTRNIGDFLKKTNLTKNEILKIFHNLYEHSIIDYKDQKRTPLIKISKHSNDLTVWMYLTEQCNFRCTYCFVNKNPKKMNETVMEKTLEKINEAAKKRASKHVKLFLAGGEPLLEMSLIKKIIKKSTEMKKVNKSIFDISIITNGSLLTDEIADYFKNKGIQIAISLDGIGKFNNLTRKFSDGSGTFKYAKKGIEIAQKYNILNGINVTLTSKNIKGLPTLVKYCLEKKIRMHLALVRQFNHISRNERKNGNVKAIIPYYKKALRIIYSYYEKKKIFHSPLQDQPLLDDLNYPVTFSDNHCGAGSIYFSITSEGNVQFCPLSQIFLASIHDEDPIQKAQNRFTPLTQRMSVKKIYKCQKCLWKYICSGGCIVERLNLNNDMNKPSYKCDLYKALMPIILDFEAKRIIKTNFFQQYSYESGK